MTATLYRILDGYIYRIDKQASDKALTTTPTVNPYFAALLL